VDERRVNPQSAGKIWVGASLIPKDWLTTVKGEEKIVEKCPWKRNQQEKELKKRVSWSKNELIREKNGVMKR